jgi:hypothetical protein
MDARSTAAYFVAATDAIPATRLTARHVAVLAPAPGAQNDATERLHRAHRTGDLRLAIAMERRPRIGDLWQRVPKEDSGRRVAGLIMSVGATHGR